MSTGTLFGRPCDRSHVLRLLRSPCTSVRGFTLRGLCHGSCPNVSSLLEGAFRASSFVVMHFAYLTLLRGVDSGGFQRILRLTVASSCRFVHHASIHVVRRIKLGRCICPRVGTCMRSGLSRHITFGIDLKLRIFSRTTMRTTVSGMVTRACILRSGRRVHGILRGTGGDHDVRGRLLDGRASRH